MKTWKIACSWVSYGIVELEAETLGDAIKIAEQDEFDLPDAEYLDDSMDINIDVTNELNHENRR